MTIKEQWKKVKENWVILSVVVVLFLFMNAGGIQNLSYSDSFSQKMGGMNYEMAYDQERSYGLSSQDTLGRSHSK